jgi:hypothetical protein
MREETKKKLDRELAKRRLGWVAFGAGFLAVLAAAMWWVDLDAHMENKRVAGIVQKVGPLNMPGMSTQAIEQSLGVDVKLGDGRTVHVAVLKSSQPAEGQAVEVTEHIHGSGRSTFSWK